ncbi:MAG: hypothetical protein ACRDXD_06575 [Acidimicrobiia bacterium]
MRLRDARMWVGLLLLTILPLVGCQQGETDFDNLPEEGTDTTADGY